MFVYVGRNQNLKDIKDQSTPQAGTAKNSRIKRGQNADSMGPTAELIRISFSSPSGCAVAVGFM